MKRAIAWAPVALVLLASSSLRADEKDLTWPPKLPGGKTVVTYKAKEFLKPIAPLADGVKIAKEAPTVDFLYYQGQTYLGRPWSVWGDSVATGGKYYSAIGDHLAPQGNAQVYSYDPQSKELRLLVNTKEFLNLPEGHYMPGKIHSRVDMGSDGWLYYATHRGSTAVTRDEYHYKGDWILRTHPETGETQVVAQGPVPKNCIPTSVLDPERLIFYGGTAAGLRSDPTIMFFAYDTKNKKLLHSNKDGAYRYFIFAPSTGKVYYTNESTGKLMRYDPATGKAPVATDVSIGLRSATQETADGYVYTVSTGKDATIYRFNTRTEKVDELGPLAVATQTYTTTMDIDPTGRYIYYTPGAHGGSQKDGTPVIQFDVKTRTKKVIAFLQPYLQEEVGYITLGTFGSAIDPAGDKLYITWNGNRAGVVRGKTSFDTCALTVIHIPESERQP